MGRGAERAWIFRPHGRPRSVVIRLRGLDDRKETTLGSPDVPVIRSVH